MNLLDLAAYVCLGPGLVVAVALMLLSWAAAAYDFYTKQWSNDL